MNLRVKVIALILASVAILAGGSAAFAEDDDDKRPIPGSTEVPRPHQPHAEENELHDRYGEDVGQVNLPPLVIKEQPRTGAASNEKLVDAGNANPAGNIPVDPATRNSNQGTPADTFFNAASVGIGVMGVGVVALGVFAVRRSAKLRQDPKSDFLYE